MSKDKTHAVISHGDDEDLKKESKEYFEKQEKIFPDLLTQLPHSHKRCVAICINKTFHFHSDQTLIMIIIISTF